MTTFPKGHIPWNKGKTGIYTVDVIEKMREAKLRNPVKYWLGKERLTKHWLGKKRLHIKGERNYAWKGEDVSYHGLHNWVRRELGAPEKCLHCGSKTRLHWANKSRRYKRDLSDWLSLCAKCHKKYDKK